MAGNHEAEYKGREESKRMMEEDPAFRQIVLINKTQNDAFSAICGLVYELRAEIDSIKKQLEEKTNE